MFQGAYPGLLGSLATNVSSANFIATLEISYFSLLWGGIFHKRVVLTPNEPPNAIDKELGPLCLLIEGWDCSSDTKSRKGRNHVYVVGSLSIQKFPRLYNGIASVPFSVAVITP